MARKSAAAVAVVPAREVSDTSEILLLPLDQLYLHELNTRHEPPSAEIVALAESIKAAGLLQNLSGFKDGIGPLSGDPLAETANPIGIVAGGRRLRALQMLASAGEWSGPVPVRFTTNRETARLWAGAENEARQALHPADEIVAYRQMMQTGATARAIALAFAVTERHVGKRLALAGLPPQAIDALRQGKITLDIAQALTSAQTPEDQEAALRSALTNEKPAWQIKDMLRKDTVPGGDRRARYVGIAAFEAAGGRVIRDLFEDRCYFADSALLDRLATEQALAETETLRIDEGWSWASYVKDSSDLWEATSACETIAGQQADLPAGDAERLEYLGSLDEMSDEESAEMEALEDRSEALAYSDEDRATGGIFTFLDHLGSLSVRRAYRVKAKAEKTEEAEATAGPPEASFPQNLKDDLRAIRLLSLQAALCNHPDLLHDLLALQLAGALSYSGTPFAWSTEGVANMPSKDDGLSFPAHLKTPQTANGQDHVAAVVEFLSRDGGDRGRALTHGLARKFHRATGPIADFVAERSSPQVRRIWQPTAAGFLGRVSAGYLETLWRELTPDVGSSHDGFASMTKKDKAKQLEKLFSDMDFREALGLSRDQNAKIDAWLPEDLRFCEPDDQDA
jgi:ParB family transcriptional regulator, chromosome partitioning protein